MRLTNLSVHNFRAISRISLTDIPEAVVLAGPNGCGKSCVLDAIRLLKSAYGSYQQDEWQTWFGEFQINLNKEPRELLTLFQNKQQELKISGRFRLSEQERKYLRTNAKDLLEEKLWREIAPEIAQARQVGALTLASTQRAHRKQVDARTLELLPEVIKELESAEHEAVLIIEPLGAAQAEPNLLLEIIFSTYEPQQLGVVDYHGPNRNYNRERLSNINLTIQSSEDRLRQHALYNSANKYANLKTEMASAYIRHLLASRADPFSAAADDSLTATLKELFNTFFPGKQFLGPQPTTDGRLLFPVRLQDGGEHDIDDLSSGEKEVLYGYLRLHNAAPRHAIILIDEPELHLNPRLVSGLAAFYYRHLADRLDNQLWLVTHSDTLIREAVSQPHFAVYHIQPPGTVSDSQATPVKAQEDIERIVLALVGDLAAYRPGEKVVVFESSDDAAFDMRMTCTLFPEFEQQTNPISAGNKKRVADLYDLLEKARRGGHLHARFYAITDADDEESSPGPSTRYRWDVYHIENYLLEPKFVLAALRAVGISAEQVPDEAAVLASLKACAQETIAALVAHKLRTVVNRQFVSAIDLGFEPTQQDIAEALSKAITRSYARIQKRLAADISRPSLQAAQDDYIAGFTAALADGSWLSKFRGREILRRFAGRHTKGMQYEYFRELVISRMAEAGYRPPGMKEVVNAILAEDKGG